MRYTKLYALAAGAALAATLTACGGEETPERPEKTVTETAPPEQEKPSQASPEGTLPNLVGMVLQDAQDKAQKAGFYVLDDQDALYSRLQVLDDNWKVCSQDPKPGKYNTDTPVTLYSVKLDESCP